MKRCMKPYRLAAVVLTLLIHSGPLVSCATAVPPPPPKPVPLTVWDDGRDDQHLGMPDTGVLSCKKRYKGIGVRAHWTDGVITEVAWRGPAWNAGARVGDKLLSEGPFEPLGAIVNVRFSRNDREFARDMRVAEVCFSE